MVVDLFKGRWGFGICAFSKRFFFTFSTKGREGGEEG